MALFLVELQGALQKKNGVHSFLVEAANSTEAKAVAASRYDGDGDFTASDAVVTTLAAGMSANYSGWCFRVRMRNAALAGMPIMKEAKHLAGAETVAQICAQLATKLSGNAMQAAIRDDSATFTDLTTAANEDTAGDVSPFPNPTNNDAFYFGSSEKHGRLNVIIGTAGTTASTLAYEYWNGSAWTALSGVTDNTTAFSAAAGKYKITFTIPTDWATTTVNSQGPFYYVRARITAGAYTVKPLLTRIWWGVGFAASVSGTTLTVSSTGDGFGDKALEVDVFPPNHDRNLNAALVGTITHQGSAGAATSVAFLDPAVIPTNIKEFGVIRN